MEKAHGDANNKFKNTRLQRFLLIQLFIFGRYPKQHQTLPQKPVTPQIKTTIEKHVPFVHTVHPKSLNQGHPFQPLHDNQKLKVLQNSSPPWNSNQWCKDLLFF